MTALLVAYFLGYGGYIKKALRGYVTVAIFLIAFVQLSGPSVTYAQEHSAAISSIDDEDLEDEDEAETTTGDVSTGSTETDSGSTTEDEEVIAATIYNDSKGSAVEALNELLDMKSKYATLDVFKGNNTEFYELLRDRLAGYSTVYQANKFIDIVDKLDILDDDTYKVYGLNKAGIMDVLPEMADEQRKLMNSSDTSTMSKPKKKWESENTEDLILNYELFYGVDKPTVGLPIVFHIDAKGPTNIKRATWRFGNGEVRTCKRNQCNRVGVTYSGADTYDLIVVFKYTNGETGRHVFKLDVEEGSKVTKRAHGSAEDRVIIDVMENDNEGDEDEKKQEANEAEDDNTDKSDEDESEEIDLITADDDEELDEAFESLLVSIFGE